MGLPIRRFLMYLVMQVNCDNEYADTALSCSIELTAKNIKYFLDRITLVKKMHKVDNDLSAIDYSYSADWSKEALEKEGPEVREIKPEECDDLRIECESLSVTDCNVQISAYVKHSSDKIYAGTLYEDDLNKIYKALSCHKDKLALLVNEDNEIAKAIIKNRCEKGE
jgi:hypothetical protein